MLRCRVEKVFHEDLLPEADKASTEAKYIVDIFSTFDEHAIKGICHILKEKQMYSLLCAIVDDSVSNRI